MSSFLRESIVIKSTKEVVLEIHINLFLPQKITKTLSFEMGVLVKDVKDDGIKPTVQILLPLPKTQKGQNRKIKDLQDLFQNQKKFRRLIFNEELKKIGTNFKLKDETITFQQIYKITDSVIKLKHVTKGSYYRFRIENIEINSLIAEKQSSSFIGDPIKRSIKVIGFHINNERNLKDDKLDTRSNRVLFSCINTFIVCNMGVDILDSMERKKSFRVLENQAVWGKYLEGCLHGDEIMETVIYQFKKEAKIINQHKNNENVQKEFNNFKLFLRFLETENNKWGGFLTGSTIITLAFVTNALFNLVGTGQITDGIIITLIMLAALVMFFYTKWKE